MKYWSIDLRAGGCRSRTNLPPTTSITNALEYMRQLAKYAPSKGILGDQLMTPARDPKQRLGFSLCLQKKEGKSRIDKSNQ